MSNTENFAPSGFLEAPAESDNAFLRHQEYEDPIRKASIWLHKLIIHRIRDVEAVAPWYRGETDEPSGPLVSTLMSQEDGRFCDRFSYYCRIIKKYRQGAVPRQILEGDLRTASIFINLLSNLIDDTESLRLLNRRIHEFVQLVTTAEAGRLVRTEYIAKVDQLADSIVTISGRISDQFKRMEETRCGERPETATTEGVSKIVETSVSKIVEASAAKTQSCIRKTARRVVKEIRTNVQSEYDRRGPSSPARTAQLRSVIKRLGEYKANPQKLPSALRGKQPEKWIHQACRETWDKKSGGYPSMASFYVYCHRNEDQILSQAGV